MRRERDRCRSPGHREPGIPRRWQAAPPRREPPWCQPRPKGRRLPCSTLAVIGYAAVSGWARSALKHLKLDARHVARLGRCGGTAGSLLRGRCRRYRRRETSKGNSERRLQRSTGASSYSFPPILSGGRRKDGARGPLRGSLRSCTQAGKSVRLNSLARAAKRQRWGWHWRCAARRSGQRNSIGSISSLPITRRIGVNASNGETPSRLESEILMWVASTVDWFQDGSIATHRWLT